MTSLSIRKYNGEVEDHKINPEIKTETFIKKPVDQVDLVIQVLRVPPVDHDIALEDVVDRRE